MFQPICKCKLYFLCNFFAGVAFKDRLPLMCHLHIGWVKVEPNLWLHFTTQSGELECVGGKCYPSILDTYAFKGSIAFAK